MLISDWLASKNKDFDKGVALLEKNNGSAAVLRLLNQGCNSFTSSLLVKELKAIIRSAGEEYAKPPSNVFNSLPKTLIDSSKTLSTKYEAVEKPPPKRLTALIQE